MRAVAAHWGELPAREQQILVMDFSGGMSQTQIGLRLHISQMHVSRLRARALGHLRARLLDLEPGAIPGPARRQPPGRPADMTTAGADRLPSGPDSAAAIMAGHRPGCTSPLGSRDGSSPELVGCSGYPPCWARGCRARSAGVAGCRLR